MSSAIQQVLPYVLVAAGAGILGGLIAAVWVPGLRVRSAIQHFAAGVVIATVATDVVPELERIGSPAGILGGFTLGGLAMIGLKWVVHRFERREKKQGKVPVGLAAAAGVDTLIDGAIIGAGFSSGEQLGVLLALALAVELLFLTLSVGSEFHKAQQTRWVGVVVTSGISLLIIVGAVGSMLVLGNRSPQSIAAVLAFGSAALVYLVAEELLVESIQAEESLFSTAMLFAGFLAVLAFSVLGP